MNLRVGEWSASPRQKWPQPVQFPWGLFSLVGAGELWEEPYWQPHPGPLPPGDTAKLHGSGASLRRLLACLDAEFLGGPGTPWAWIRPVMPKFVFLIHLIETIISS